MVAKAFLTAVASALMILPALVAGQDIDTCSCAPTVYRFRLDFNRTCDDNTFEVGKTAGIDRFFCRTGDGIGGGNRAPVTLSSFLILELDSTLSVMKQYYRDGLSLVDGDNGDSFEYTSIVAAENENEDGDDNDKKYPAALQMSMTGTTKDGTEVVSQFILTFTNLCGTPVFREGDSVSWVVLVSLAMTMERQGSSLWLSAHNIILIL